MIDKKGLLAKLEGMPSGRMYLAAFRALMRLQVYFTGRTHETMLAYTERARGLTLRAGGKEGTLDGVSGFGLQAELLRSWGDTWSEWTAEFRQAQREAAWIAFGAAAVMHDRLVAAPLTPPIAGSTPKLGGEKTETVVDGVYEPQLRILMDAAEEIIFEDGLNLSGRIWRIDRETREGINRVIVNGIQKGDSAWNMAKDLEQFLGAGADCPRWTSTRLYGRTKKEIAGGDKSGLLTGAACDGSGVSYNALRLARTEIQRMHGLATDRMLAQQPWVEQEQIHLSAAHPKRDICDDAVEGGEEGKGIYTVGTILLPLHPNCLCRKSAVMMPQGEFTSKLRGWMRQEEEWPGMDRYAADLGVDLATQLAPQAAIRLAVWLFGDDLEEWMR